MRVLVTGAGGFVGGQVACVLAASGHEVVAVTRGALWRSLEGMPGIQVARLDLAAGQAFQKASFDAVIHCAAAIPAAVPDESELFRVNVESTRRVFDYAAQSGATSLIFCSSMATFGHIEDEVVSPDTPPHDPSVYGRSKLEGERLLAELCSQRPTLRGISIRLPGIVGAGSHHNFLSDTMARLLAGAPTKATNPDALFNNVVHVADLSVFMMHLLGEAPCGHGVITMAADEPLSICDVIAILEKVAGRKGATTFSSGGHSFLINDASARKLGYHPAKVADSVARFARDAAAFADNA